MPGFATTSALTAINNLAVSDPGVPIVLNSYLSQLKQTAIDPLAIADPGAAIVAGSYLDRLRVAIISGFPPATSAYNAVGMPLGATWYQMIAALAATSFFFYFSVTIGGVIDIGTGPPGSETVIFTMLCSANASIGPVLLKIPAGTRISLRNSFAPGTGFLSVG
jgi:hypothetical protein